MRVKALISIFGGGASYAPGESLDITKEEYERLSAMNAVEDAGEEAVEVDTGEEAVEVDTGEEAVEVDAGEEVVEADAPTSIYDSMTVAELKALLLEKGIEAPSGAKKSELIAILD